MDIPPSDKTPTHGDVPQLTDVGVPAQRPADKDVARAHPAKNFPTNRDVADAIQRTNTPPSPPPSPQTATQVSPSHYELIALITDLFKSQANQLNAKLDEQKDQLNTKLDEQKDQLNNFNSKLDEQKNQFESKLDQKMNHLNDKFDEQKESTNKILKQYEIITQQVADIRISQDNCKQEIEAIQTVQRQQTEQIINLERNLRQENEERDLSIQLKINNTLLDQQNEIKSFVNSQNQDLNKSLNQKLDSYRADHYQQIKNFESNQIKTITTTIEANITQLKDEINPKIELNAYQIRMQNDTIEKITNKIDTIEIEHQKPSHQLPTQINVTCTGNNIPNLETNIPKFNGRNSHPYEFLRKLKIYYKRNLTRKPTNIDDRDFLVDLIEYSVESHAARWFNLVRESVRDWDDFEKMIMDKYWSKEIQRNTRTRITNDRYRTNGTLTRSEYFIDRVNILKQLTPALQEDEILEILVGHYDETVKSARRVQNIQSVNDFESLLQRLDLEDSVQNDKGRSPSYKYEQRTSPSKQNKPYNSSYANHNQNQPKHEYSNKYNNNAYRPHNTSYQYNRPNEPYNKNHRTYRHEYQQSRNRTNNTEPKQYPTHEQRNVCATITARPSDANTPNPVVPANLN